MHGGWVSFEVDDQLLSTVFALGSSSQRQKDFRGFFLPLQSALFLHFLTCSTCALGELAPLRLDEITAELDMLVRQAEHAPRARARRRAPAQRADGVVHRRLRAKKKIHPQLERRSRPQKPWVTCGTDSLQGGDLAADLPANHE